MNSQVSNPLLYFNDARGILPVIYANNISMAKLIMLLKDSFDIFIVYILHILLYCSIIIPQDYRNRPLGLGCLI